MPVVDVRHFLEALAAANPEPRSELTFADPFTLLVAVVLSAQATDISVNRATETLFKDAEASFEQLSSVSHRAAAWIAQGDLAVRRGEDLEAAHLYRRAAEALQDFRF